MTFTLTLGWWIAPTLISIYCLYRLHKTAKSGGGQFDFVSPLLAALWLIPALVVWVIYLAIA